MEPSWPLLKQRTHECACLSLSLHLLFAPLLSLSAWNLLPSPFLFSSFPPFAFIFAACLWRCATPPLLLPLLPLPLGGLFLTTRLRLIFMSAASPFLPPALPTEKPCPWRTTRTHNLDCCCPYPCGSLCPIVSSTPYPIQRITHLFSNISRSILVVDLV